MVERIWLQKIGMRLDVKREEPMLDRLRDYIRQTSKDLLDNGGIQLLTTANQAILATPSGVIPAVEALLHFGNVPKLSYISHGDLYMLLPLTCKNTLIDFARNNLPNNTNLRCQYPTQPVKPDNGYYYFGSIIEQNNGSNYSDYHQKLVEYYLQFGVEIHDFPKNRHHQLFATPDSIGIMNKRFYNAR